MWAGPTCWEICREEEGEVSLPRPLCHLLEAWQRGEEACLKGQEPHWLSGILGVSAESQVLPSSRPRSSDRTDGRRGVPRTCSTTEGLRGLAQGAEATQLPGHTDTAPSLILPAATALGLHGLPGGKVRGGEETGI